MPIYEYRCQQCGHELEKIQKMSDAPLSECPSCGQASLKKLVSAAAFRLKGGGWYETDFKSGSRKNLVETGESTGKPAADGKDAKSETAKTKPAKTSTEKQSAD